MTEHERSIIVRINNYAEEVLKDIDPQRTRTGFQIFRDIAKEEGISDEDMFIKYMDLQTEYKLEEENRFKEEFEGLA